MNNNNIRNTNENVAPLNQSQQQHPSHQNATIIGANDTPTNDANASNLTCQTSVPARTHHYSHEMGVNVNNNDESQQQLPSQQTLPQQQNRRDGPRATINLPPGTRIQPSIMPTADNAGTQPDGNAAATLYGHQVYQQQQTAAAATQAGYAYGGAAAQIAPTGQYYTTYNQYYPNPSSGYALAPQALIMPQTHTHQPTYQLIGQSQGITNAHAHHQMGGIQVQQHPQTVGSGIPATAVSHIPPQNIIVTSAGGGSISNATNIQQVSMQPLPTQQQQQPAKPKKILQFVDPNSGDVLKLGADSKTSASAASSTTQEDENKSNAKTEFLKKVAERAAEAAAVSSSQQQNRRSPFSYSGTSTDNFEHSEQQSSAIQKDANLNMEPTVGGFNETHQMPVGISMAAQIHHSMQLHHTSANIPSSLPIPIENAPPTFMQHHSHSPSKNNLPSILEIKVTQPTPHHPQLHQPHQHPPIILHPQRKEEEINTSIPPPRFEMVISPAMEQMKITTGNEKEAKSQLHNETAEQQELNGGDQSPSLAATTDVPADEGGGISSEENLRQLEEELQKIEGIRDETHDPDAMIYSRNFLMLLRKISQAMKTAKCPKTEEELVDLGLSRRGMPVNQFTVTNKKRFDMGGNDAMFKPSWQQAGGGGGGGSQFGGGGGPRFGGNRPPNYMGRHSDNKIKPKKGQVVGRTSMDQRQPIKLAQIQQDAHLKKSANAWKSKREERFDMNAPQKDEDEAKYEKLKKEIRGLLNKITPSTYEDLSNDFCAYKINDDPKLLTPIIDLIFDKAVEEPHFCPLYSDLCKKQVDMEMQLQRQAQRDRTPDEQQQFQQQQSNQKTKDKNFRNEIILKCQRTFLASSEYDKKMNELEEKLKGLDESDEKGKAQIEEELEMRRSKEKRRLLGIIKFIGQLYRHQLLVEMIIDWCAIELIKRYQATTDEVYIEYAVELVDTIGKIYEQRKEQALQKQTSQPAPQRTAAQVLTGPEQKSEYRLDMVFSHLSQLKGSVSNRIRFAILNLEDLRKNNWVPRGGEKGPKTIEEVREEVEKEQQENELERMEHEKQKEKDKLQPLRKSSGRPGYVGRSSADRRQAAAASSLLSRDSSKAESRITGLSRLSDLDNMPTMGRKAWQPTHRDRTPQKDGSGGGGGGGAGGSSSQSGSAAGIDAWRGTKSGTDSPKEKGQQ